jgi:hypothetical protein
MKVRYTSDWWTSNNFACNYKIELVNLVLPHLSTEQKQEPQPTTIVITPC